MVDERAIWSAAAADVDEASLVLAALGIAHRVERGALRWRIVVAGVDAERAGAALAAYESERRRAASDEPGEQGAAWSGVVVAAVLVALYAVAGARWMEAGAAIAGRIRAGEVWRTVTALTLHVDAAHLASNAFACVVFVTAVARLLGPGVGVGLVLLAGAGGNELNALLQRPGHESVGASTALFGAIGVLGGLQFGRKRGERRAWLALGGSLALLAMLGAGERVDLVAHLCGLVVGLVLGIAAAAVAPVSPAGRAVQWPLVAAALATVAGAWAVALTQ